jgi:uncharacterized membrane protein (GlpM family)
MLALKLLLVPSFLLVLSLVGKHFGPSISGWLAGLPVVAGPILLVLALENGGPFAAVAAAAATGAVFASVSFCLVYAHVSQRFGWFASLAAALVAWMAAVTLLIPTSGSVTVGLAVAIGTVVLAPRLFPVVVQTAGTRHPSAAELLLRMAVGAALTVGVTVAAATVGSSWSGVLAVFPVLGSVLAVSSHRTSGAAFSSALLRAMTTGLYSFIAFCATLAVALPKLSVSWAFLGAVAACLLVHAGTGRRFARSDA